MLGGTAVLSKSSFLPKCGGRGGVLGLTGRTAKGGGVNGDTFP